MKKPLALLFLSFTIACSAWAEKYEYVRLKGSASPVTDLSDYGLSNVNVWDSFTLESGDVAECISSNTNNYHYVLDGDSVHRHDSAWGNGYAGFKSIFAGPCTIYLAGTASNATGIHETWRIKRASDSGSTTLAWNGTEWEGSSGGSQQANNDSSGGIDPSSIKYDELLGWTWLTDTNWVYSYTNLSWYYMHSVGGDIYVWNANLPDNGWQKLERG